MPLKSAALCGALLLSGVAGCARKQAANPAAAQRGPMPVMTLTVASQPVAQSDEYVATIKSRRSATINPQVDGNLIAIDVHSGDHVKKGQMLMQIDPLKQKATVDSQAATVQQKLAVYQFNQIELDRQRKLFAAGITSKDSLDQEEQAYRNAKADYDASQSSLDTQQRELAYYRITAPFDGVVGDIPVHVGDYVTSSTMLTTVDENKDLEAYIYIPTERASEVRTGLGVDILDNAEHLVEHTKIDFLSPQVDNGLQSILAKAPVHSEGAQAMLRTAQLVKAKVIWSTRDTPTVPVLAVTRLGGQSFVYVASGQDGRFVARQKAVTLGDTVGNNYAVLGGLTNGDKVIVSGTQFLQDGAPVQPLG